MDRSEIDARMFRCDQAKLRSMAPFPTPPQFVHELTFEAQPIADQWMGKCSCGWRETASLYEFDTRDAAIEHLKVKHRDHVLAAWRSEPTAT